MNDQLTKYDVISSSDLKHRIVKRGTDSQSINRHKFDHLKEVKFNALGRDFKLILNEKRHIVSSNFKVFTVNASGKKTPYGILNPDEFYEGRVYGDSNSSVSAHIDSESGLLTATINLDNGDVYIVEPTWRHEASGPKRYNVSTADQMVIYKASDTIHSKSPFNKQDVPSESSSFCDYVKIDDYVPYNETLANLAQERSRYKRNAFSFNSKPWDDELPSFTTTRCSLLLVADYLFYQHMGGEDKKQTVNFLISLVDRVNNMFQKTEWSEKDERPINGLGFLVYEILVHDEPNAQQEHYNNDQRVWDVRNLLKQFSLNQDNRDYCLAHLFTHRKFDNAVLGLAYVSSPRPHSVGGICSAGYPDKDKRTYYYNTGLTTTRNTFGQPIITRVTDLVTAHELGHNWGAEHDPDITECSPSSRSGGAYIMYTYSVSGYDENNKVIFFPFVFQTTKFLF